MQNKIFLITCTDWNYSALFLISFAVFRLTPLSPLPFRLPWRGCWHFFDGRNLTPRTARCLRQIVKSRPSSSSNKPTRAKMSFFSDTTHDWDTFTSLRCSFMPSAHEFSGISCCRPGHRQEKSHSVPQKIANEQESWDILRLYSTNAWLKRTPLGRLVK